MTLLTTAQAALPCSVPGCTNTSDTYRGTQWEFNAETGMCGWHSKRAANGMVLDPCCVEDCPNFDAQAALADRRCFAHIDPRVLAIADAWPKYENF
jgi:hypothetical protein